MSSLQCMWPFTSVAVDHEGNVNLCPCVQWTTMKPIGNIHSEKIADIWNSDLAVGYREIFLKGKAETLCKKNLCAYLQAPEKVQSEEVYLTEKNRCAVEKDTAVLPDLFTRVKLDTDRRCNIACKMCRTEKVTKRENDTTAVVLEQLKPLLSSVMEFHPATAGEPLFIKEMRELLESNLLMENNVVVELVTNATLFTSGMWEKLKHNTFSYVKVSLDSVEKKTYESIRRGASHEQTMKNLEMLSRLKSEGSIGKIQWTIVVMRSNFREIPSIVERATAMGVDCVKLLALNGHTAPDEMLSRDEERELAAILLRPELHANPVLEVWGLRHLLSDGQGS